MQEIVKSIPFISFSTFINQFQIFHATVNTKKHFDAFLVDFRFAPLTSFRHRTIKLSIRLLTLRGAILSELYPNLNFLNDFRIKKSLQLNF